MKNVEDNFIGQLSFDAQSFGEDDLKIIGIDVAGGGDCSVCAKLNLLTKEYTYESLGNQGL